MREREDTGLAAARALIDAGVKSSSVVRNGARQTQADRERTVPADAGRCAMAGAREREREREELASGRACLLAGYV
jgi:hypothetical protein